MAAAAARFYHPEVETLSRQDLLELQLTRLRWQLQRCYEGSAFYRERFDRAGAHPDQVRSLDDIRRFPFVTKQELRDEQAARPPFGRFTVAPASDWCELHPSSGTTGNPVNTIWSYRDVETISDFTARTLWSFGVRPGDVIQNAFSYGLWVAGMAVHYAARRLGCFVIPIGAQLTERQILYLRTSRPTALFATPSYGLYIAERLSESGVAAEELSLRIGSFGGEGGTELPSTRAKLEQGLGVDAYDIYGLAELGPTFAAECEEKAGLHWAEDHFYLEVIDPETMESCRPGEVGVLVVTHLSREATPMVRYWTNDYAWLTDEPCRCGRTHRRPPGGILGRHDDLIVYRGAKFYPIQVEEVVRAFPELTNEYQIVLARDGRTGLESCTVVAEVASPNSEEEGLARRLQEALAAACLVRPEVRLEPAGTLERTTFKARRVLDRRREGKPA